MCIRDRYQRRVRGQQEAVFEGWTEMASLFEEKKHKLTALDLASKALDDERVAAGEAEEEEVDDGIKGWTAQGTIQRLISKESKDYYNLDPFRVLGLKWNASMEEAKKRFRKVSLLVHPDRNMGSEEATDAFDAVKKAHASIETPEKWQIAQRIVKEAMCRVEDEIKTSQKEAKRKGEMFAQPKKEELEIAVGVSITKIYGEMENKRRDMEQREANQKRRAGDQDNERRKEFLKKQKMEKQWEESRDGRMASWNKFIKKGKKKRRDMPARENVMEERDSKQLEALGTHEEGADRNKQATRNGDQGFKKQWR
eukprot:TRINITY_DN6273_c0_g1_i1.p1 TRINITY_DN6273_c0_g1~~TRINITY_DN6273_c0_g1_i1.p1  ORF type:complete len:311 (+),score=110.81 TRINITY_DN6273_c0_g1_i1:68-1000(+)